MLFPSVLTLGYSRKAVRLLVFQSSTQTWAELHEQAFRRLGGCTRVVVLDNLGEGVLKPDIYDPTLNPVYADMLRHYGVVAMPCRVADPDRKGKVESGVGHAQKTPLKGMRFESPQEAQGYLDHWEARWADTRIHGTTKRQVAAMFAEERPALLPLPVEPFRYYQYGERTVHLGEIYRPLALAVHLKEGELEYYRGRLESSRDCLTYFQQNESALPNGSGRMRFRSRECGPVLAGSVQWRRQQSVRTAHTRGIPAGILGRPGSAKQEHGRIRPVAVPARRRGARRQGRASGRSGRGTALQIGGCPTLRIPRQKADCSRSIRTIRRARARSRRRPG